MSHEIDLSTGSAAVFTCRQCGLPTVKHRKYCSDPCYWEHRTGQHTRDPESLRREAICRGLEWADVQDCFELLQEALEGRFAHADEIRRAAWGFATAGQPRLRHQWRNGFAGKYGRQVAARDYTVIPRYDEIAQQIAWWFPEFADDTGCERLWDSLLAPPEPRPDWRALYRAAMEVVERQEAEDAAENPSHQFGAW